MPEIWEDVRVTITRDKIPDENGPCANHLARDDDKSASLSQGQCKGRGLATVSSIGKG